MGTPILDIALQRGGVVVIWAGVGVGAAGVSAVGTEQGLARLGKRFAIPLPYYAVSAPSRLEPPVEEETRALKNQVKYYEDALRSTQAFIKELMEETKQE